MGDPEDLCARCGLARGFHGPTLAEPGDPQCAGFAERAAKDPRDEAGPELRKRIAEVCECVHPYGLVEVLRLLSATRDGSGSPLMQQPEARQPLVRAGGGR